MNGIVAYLNTDLDLASATDLRALAATFEAEEMLVLHCEQRETGNWHARLETGLQHQEPETNILAMLDVVESLPAHLHDIWVGCTRRDFCIGYDCGNEPQVVEHGLSSTTLARLAAAGAGITITLYASHD